MYFLKPIFIIIGTLSLITGIIGIVVPGLPTTPFLLLTAGLYLKSSNRLYNKVISNKWIGPYIIQYQKNKGISLRMKFYSICLMSIMIASSCIFFINSFQYKLIVIALGIIGTIVMILFVPTANQESDV